MTEERIEIAVKRIEAALARISTVADASSPEPAAPQADASALAQKHEMLRKTVSSTLNELDELIGELGQ
ncbi:hypothetical protein GCM10023115_19020 [Pontixanthobacter gangjinensis]|uniref:Uncharacterized protein n=1 Tax=Pontixanthobacter gangjinensis TaxID=1028742 RepID=A0A6I4SMM0_9SPHN|nr:hypothetical protein [Pontixanthobacter gangjinensis]MXO57151.1 hypothetical protein [Pontixanthobacter gangjinensis]